MVRQAVSAGALDMVAALSGPLGAGATFVSSILSHWGTEDNKANLELIAKEIKEEVLSTPYLGRATRAYPQTP